MKILDRYILKSFIVTFLTVFVILFLIFVLQTVWLFIGELAGKDLDLPLIFKFLIYKMPSVVPLVLPLSIVLASIMTFGSFSENYEFAAMKSAGISLRRAMLPLTIFIAGMSLASFFFANNVIPFAEYKFINFRRNIAQVKPAMAIAEGQFNSIGDYNIKVDKKSGENGNRLTGVTIHKKSNQGLGNNTVVIKSKSGELQSNEESNTLKLVLNNGYYYEDIIPKKFEERDKLPFAKSSFKRYIINIDLSKLNKTNLDDEQITNTNTMLNVAELSYTIDSLSTNYEKEIKSFSENIYGRTGAFLVKKPIIAVASPEADATPDLMSVLDKSQKAQVAKVAAGSVSNTIFSIEGTRYEMENKIKNLNNHWIALYDKFVIAFSCFLMFFIGAPLGAIIRKGGLGLPIVFAVLIFIIFHFVNTFGKKVAQEDGITPFLGTWLSTMILGPLAVFLTYRATNDRSVTMNFDWLVVPFRKLFLRKKMQPALSGADVAAVTGEDVDWRKLDLLADTALLDIVRNVEQMHYTPAFQAKAKNILIGRGHELEQENITVKNTLSDAKRAAIAESITLYNFYSVVALISNVVAILSWIATQKHSSIMSIAVLALATLLYTSYNASLQLRKIGGVIDKKIGLSLFATMVFSPFYIFIYFYNKSALTKAISN